MAVHLKCVQFKKKECDIHSMPCKIHADDNAKVSSYFKTTILKDEGLSASFRGHSLDGKTLPLPDSYSGMVFKELQKPETEEEDRSLIMTNTFQSFTYWNWNKLPTKSDPLISALDWIEISQAVHDPAKEE